MHEEEHVQEVLVTARKALQTNDALLLKDLSNQTIHTAATVQDTDSILIAVLTYSLSKILERKDTMKVKYWTKFTKKADSILSLALQAAESNNQEALQRHLELLRKAITSIAPSIKPQVEEVLRKASINKATRIYEHGISLGQTAQLLGLTQWELTDYMGQSKVNEGNYNQTIDTKKRAKMALEFFS